MSFKVSEYNYWMTHATKIRCKEADNLKWIRLKTQCFKVNSYYETLRGGGNFFFFGKAMYHQGWLFSHEVCD